MKSRLAILFAAAVYLGSVASGQALAASPASGQAVMDTKWFHHALEHTVTRAVLRSIPHEHVDRSDWGRTKYMTTGLDVEVRGLKIETRRRKKHVKHGSWRMYRLQLINPDKEFRIRLANFHDAGEGMLGFDAVVTGRVKAFARLAQWRRGVQLLAISGEGDARLHLKLACVVGVDFDAQKVPPDVIIRPEVRAADLRIVDYRLNRVSKVGGSVARQIGRSMEWFVDRRVDKLGAKIVKKANEEIADSEDDLRLSVQDNVTDAVSDLFGRVKKSLSSRKPKDAEAGPRPEAGMD